MKLPIGSGILSVDERRHQTQIDTNMEKCTNIGYSGKNLDLGVMLSRR